MITENCNLRKIHQAQLPGTLIYKVVQIWPGLFVCKQVTVCPGHIWTTLYVALLSEETTATLQIRPNNVLKVQGVSEERATVRTAKLLCLWYYSNAKSLLTVIKTK